MRTQSEIESLADLKFNEAQCLFQNNYFDGAYYLAGYVIELLLKARVCKALNISDFFLFSRGKPEAYKPYKSHDYDQLLIFSGLFADFSSKSLSDPVFKAHWSIVNTWSEGSRYLTGKTDRETQTFLTSVLEISTWIKRHL